MGQVGLCFGAFDLINCEDNTCAGCLSTAAADYLGSESAPSYTVNETSRGLTRLSKPVLQIQSGALLWQKFCILCAEDTEPQQARTAHQH